MTITNRPTRSASVLGGSVDLPEAPCRHDPPRSVAPWTGEPGTAGTVTVVGAGKMGLPLAAQFASHGWAVIAVDVNEAVVAAINAGRAHVGEEPGLAERVADAHAAGRLRATRTPPRRSRESDVVVLIVPVMLDDRHQPDYRYMDAAARLDRAGLRPGSTVIFETTLPVGDTRTRYLPLIEAATGLVAERGPVRRLLARAAVLRGRVPEPCDVPEARGRDRRRARPTARRVLRAVLDAEVVAMSSAEAAELRKLADTTYRDVNIAFANELAAYAGRVGVDVLEVIPAANSQPYSHVHQPGIGVGGHCIPVYPHFLLSRAPEMELVEASRADQRRPGRVAIRGARRRARRPRGRARPRPRPDLPRGREGARLHARAAADRRGSSAEGARVSAWDPLLPPTRSRAPAPPWTWGSTSDARAIVTQTADPVSRGLDPTWFPARSDLRRPEQPARRRRSRTGSRVLGIGVPARGTGRVMFEPRPDRHDSGYPSPTHRLGPTRRLISRGRNVGR